MAKGMEGAVQNFVKAIFSTPEYKNYAMQREKLRRYPELKKQVDEYRASNYRLQTETDPDRLFEETDKFQQEYEALWEDPIVSAFLTAELSFCRLMQEVNMEITEAIDFD